jgi:biopolymer transport protein ExbB
MQAAFDQFLDLMHRGGWVMWPLLALSALGVALVFERVWFWLATNSPGRVSRMRRAAQLLRQGSREAAMHLAHGDRSVYGRVVQRLIQDGAGEAVATDAIENQRPRLERFMPTLSTIITAAPLLGILGTVTGIISSFQLLSDRAAATDPRNVSHGIAEALLTTAAGLTVAIFVLFPYNGFRAQIDRTLGRLESLVAAARSGPTSPANASTPTSSPANTPSPPPPNPADNPS